MPARCRIDLTEQEAAALLVIIANSADDLDDVFQERLEIAAAQRASEKVRLAWRDKFHPSPRAACGRCKGRGANVPGPGGQNFGCPGCGLTRNDVGQNEIATRDGVRPA